MTRFFAGFGFVLLISAIGFFAVDIVGSYRITRRLMVTNKGTELYSTPKAVRKSKKETVELSIQWDYNFVEVQAQHSDMRQKFYLSASHWAALPHVPFSFDASIKRGWLTGVCYDISAVPYNRGSQSIANQFFGF